MKLSNSCLLPEGKMLSVSIFGVSVVIITYQTLHVLKKIFHKLHIAHVLVEAKMIVLNYLELHMQSMHGDMCDRTCAYPHICKISSTDE